MLETKKKQYHLPIAPGDVGEYVLLPGDPGRCRSIAAFLENARFFGVNREFEVWNGTLEGEKVTVCSTGIGGPSTAIAAEELTACGARTLIRVGTCGGISLDVRNGDLVVATGAVRQDGTSREYAPLMYPAVPTFEVLAALNEAAGKSGLRAHCGVVQSKDSFYGQHSPQRMPVSGELTAQWEAWKRLGVLASEMEASTLFTVGAALGIRTGAIFLAVWNQERYAAGLDTDASETHDTDPMVRTAVEAIRILIRREKGAEA